MKNKLEEMMEDLDFVIFLDNFRHAANYYVAVDQHLEPEAVLLCIAYAYEAGKKNRKAKNDIS